MAILDLIRQSGIIVKSVLFLLLSASFFCWAVIFTKYVTLKRIFSQNQEFLKLFWSGKGMDEIFNKSEKSPCPLAILFKSGYLELKKLNNTERSPDGGQEVQNIHRALMRASTAEVSTLEKYLNWLATTASSAPFVGLFGTVWGIMNSFQNIGATGAANLAVVAPGISEALIATAVGLAAAIPAVIAYNQLVTQIKRIAIDMDCFSQDFLNIIQRSLMTGKK